MRSIALSDSIFFITISVLILFVLQSLGVALNAQALRQNDEIEQARLTSQWLHDRGHKVIRLERMLQRLQGQGQSRFSDHDRRNSYER